MKVLTILLAAGWTFTVSYFTGRLLLRRLRIALFREEEHIFSFLTGASLLSLFVFLLSAAHLAYCAAFVVLGALLVMTSMRFGRENYLRSTSKTPLPALLRGTFWILFGIFGILYFVNALAPDVSPDGTVYHVSLPALYYRAHGFPGIRTNFLANLSEGMEMLFLFAFAIGRHSAPAVVHLLFGLITPLAMISFARRYGIGAAGIVGALLFFISPVVGIDASSPYVDAAAAAVVFGVFYLLEIWREEMNPRLLVPIGLLCGFGYAIKYTTALTIPYAIGYIAVSMWRKKGGMQSWLRASAMVAVCSLVLVSPWMAKNFLTVGNPVSPFANRYFPNPYVSVAVEQQYSRAMSRITVGQPANLFASRMDGLLGPVFLLAPIALVALGRPIGRRLLASAFVFLIPYPASPTVRYLIPALPFIALALGLALIRWRAIAVAVLIAHAVLSCPLVTAEYSKGWRIRGFPWRAALRIQSQDSYLRERMGGDYDMGRILDVTVPNGERVFSLDLMQSSYYKTELVVPWLSSFGKRIEYALLRSRSNDPEMALVYRFTPLPVRRLRVVAEKWGAGALSLTELRLFHQGTEIARNPAWRIRASANDWDVALAFDNNPATAWSSEAVQRPGMYIEIELDALHIIDEVKVETFIQDSNASRLEVDPDSGHYETLTATRSITPLPRSRLELWYGAVAYLKQNGVPWILIDDGNGFAPELRVRKQRWGVTEVAKRGSLRLYHID